MPVSLGWKPIEVIIVLDKGQDYILTLSPRSGTPSPNFPVGTTVVMKFYDPHQDTSLPLASWDVIDEWDATISGDDVSFRAESNVVEAIPNGALVKVFATYPNTPQDDNYVWMKGRAVLNA